MNCRHTDTVGMETSGEEAFAWPEGVLAIRAGNGANCSSVGSAVDFLFAASVGAGALVVAVGVALASYEKSGPTSESPEERAEPQDDARAP